MQDTTHSSTTAAEADKRNHSPYHTAWSEYDDDDDADNADADDPRAGLNGHNTTRVSSIDPKRVTERLERRHPDSQPTDTEENSTTADPDDDPFSQPLGDIATVVHKASLTGDTNHGITDDGQPLDEFGDPHAWSQDDSGGYSGHQTDAQGSYADGTGAETGSFNGISEFDPLRDISLDELQTVDDVIIRSETDPVVDTITVENYDGETHDHIVTVTRTDGPNDIPTQEVYIGTATVHDTDSETLTVGVACRNDIPLATEEITHGRNQEHTTDGSPDLLTDNHLDIVLGRDGDHRPTRAADTREHLAAARRALRNTELTRPRDGTPVRLTERHTYNYEHNDYTAVSGFLTTPSDKLLHETVPLYLLNRETLTDPTPTVSHDIDQSAPITALDTIDTDLEVKITGQHRTEVGANEVDMDRILKDETLNNVETVSDLKRHSVADLIAIDGIDRDTAEAVMNELNNDTITVDIAPENVSQYPDLQRAHNAAGRSLTDIDTLTELVQPLIDTFDTTHKTHLDDCHICNTEDALTTDGHKTVCEECDETVGVATPDTPRGYAYESLATATPELATTLVEDLATARADDDWLTGLPLAAAADLILREQRLGRSPQAVRKTTFSNNAGRVFGHHIGDPIDPTPLEDLEPLRNEHGEIIQTGWAKAEVEVLWTHPKPEKVDPGIYQKAVVKDVNTGATTTLTIWKDSLEFRNEDTTQNDFGDNLRYESLDPAADSLIAGDVIRITNAQPRPGEQSSSLKALGTVSTNYGDKLALYSRDNGDAKVFIDNGVKYELDFNTCHAQFLPGDQIPHSYQMDLNRQFADYEGLWLIDADEDSFNHFSNVVNEHTPLSIGTTALKKAAHHNTSVDLGSLNTLGGHEITESTQITTVPETEIIHLNRADGCRPADLNRGEIPAPTYTASEADDRHMPGNIILTVPGSSRFKTVADELAEDDSHPLQSVHPADVGGGDRFKKATIENRYPDSGSFWDNNDNDNDSEDSENALNGEMTGLKDASKEDAQIF